jgi:uncharacterized membrane protein required for colicin V production
VKKPQIDFFAKNLGTRMQNAKFIRRFVKYWGVELWNGVEVMRLYNYWYWPRADMAHLRFMPETECKESDYYDIVCKPDPSWSYVEPTQDSPGGWIQIGGEGTTTVEPAKICEKVYKKGEGPVQFGKPTKCTYERKLFEFLGIWEQLRDASTRGIDWAWFFLNPNKALDLEQEKEKIRTEMNEFMHRNVDKNNRITFKAKIVASDIWIPGVTVGTGDAEDRHKEILLTLNNIDTTEMVEEEVYQLDDKGNIVYRDEYDYDSKGMIIPSSKRSVAIKIKEMVPSIPSVLDQIHGNESLWGNNLVEAIWNPPIPKNESVLGGAFDVVNNVLSSDEKYAKLLTRYLLIWGDKSKIRVEYVQKGIVRYEVTGDVPEDGNLIGQYTNVAGGTTIEYQGVNRGYSGQPYTAVFYVPTYEIQYVVRDYPEMLYGATNKHKKKLEDNKTKLEKELATLLFPGHANGLFNITAVQEVNASRIAAINAELTSINSELADIEAILKANIFSRILTDADGVYTRTDEYGDTDGITTSGYTVVELIKGKVNGYVTHKALLGLEPINDQTINNGGFFGVTPYDIRNPDWWVAGFNMKGRMQYFLKKEVLTTSKYIPKLEDRVKFVNRLIDSGYEASSSSGGFMSILVIIAAVVIAYVSAGTASEESAALIGSTAAATAVTVATFIVVFSLAITIGSMILSSMGNYSDSMFLSRMYKQLSPLVQVASIVLVVVSIYTWVNNAVNTATTATTTTEEGANASLAETEATTSSKLATMADKVTNAVMNEVKDFVSGKIEISQVIKAVNFAFNMYSNNELSSLSDKIKSKQDKLEEYQEAKEQSKYSDIVAEMQRILFDPLYKIGASYEFDRPFEPIFGKMHSGNSCKTTVVALMGDGNKTYTDNTV